MQIDWSTFLLEILNFLVLVWILKRFLYQPVLDSIDVRAKRIATQISDAEKTTKAAETLKQQYESRLTKWNQECETSRQELARDLDQERKKRLEELQKYLKEERKLSEERDKAINASHEALLLKQTNDKAFAKISAMLTRVADKFLTISLADMLVEDLSSLTNETLKNLQNAANKIPAGENIEVYSAHELDKKTEDKIKNALAKLLDKKVKININVSSQLIAGLRVAIGEYVLYASVFDELEFFRKEETANAC